MTIDHIVPKSKGGPHFAKWNNAPACLSCNAAKGSLPVFEWWRPQKFWTMEREQALLSWVHSNSFVSAHSAIGSWEEWMVELKRYKDEHGHVNVPLKYEPNLSLGSFVNNQRTKYRLYQSEKTSKDGEGDGRSGHNTMTEEMIRDLEDLGFVWNLRTGK